MLSRDEQEAVEGWVQASPNEYGPGDGAVILRLPAVPSFIQCLSWEEAQYLGYTLTKRASEVRKSNERSTS